jgi:preprotein translocase subunit SecD
MLRFVAGVVAACSLLGLVACGRSSSSGNPGVEIVLRAVAPSGTRVSDSDLERSVDIMRNRLDRLGGRGSITHEAGSQAVVVRLDGASISAAGIIGKTAMLELYDLTPSLLPPSIGPARDPVPAASLHSLLKSRGGKVPPNAVVVTCNGTIAVVCPGVGPPAPGVTYYYLFKHGVYPHDTESPYPQMSGKELKPTGTQQDVDPVSGQPIVTIQFTKAGNRIFHEVTRAEAVRGQALGSQQSFAIVLDDQLCSFPTIDYRQYPGGIDPTAGGAEITGMASLSEAKHVALLLQSGALSVKFAVVSRKAVG